MKTLLLVPGAALAMALAGCGDTGPTSTPSPAATVAATSAASGCPVAVNPKVDNVAKVGPDDFNATGDVQTTPSCLEYIDISVGTGASPQPGQKVTVQYTGWLTNGTKFDSSRDRGQPFTFTIGQGQVIGGWDEGVATMKVGGRRKLIIPPQLGYGDRGAGQAIPPGATLVFMVELVSIA